MGEKRYPRFEGPILDVATSQATAQNRRAVHYLAIPGEVVDISNLEGMLRQDQGAACGDVLRHSGQGGVRSFAGIPGSDDHPRADGTSAIGPLGSNCCWGLLFQFSKEIQGARTGGMVVFFF